MLFDWNQSNNADILNVWDISVNADGSISLSSTDFDNDGIPGTPMVDGAFIGFNASYDLTLTPVTAVPVPATI